VGVIDHTTRSKPVKPLQAEIAKTHTLSPGPALQRGVLIMRTMGTHPAGSVAAQQTLQALAGWQPTHRSLESEAAELADITERDNAARVTFSRGAH
jgi:hypothetical protein